MRNFKQLLTIAMVFVLVGCTHQINISPDHSELLKQEFKQAHNKSVALYIPNELIDLEVTTPGGGGEKVSYKPYKDTELGLYQVLSNVYKNVITVNKLNDINVLTKNKIDYIIQPKLVTNSSSSSILTWPPTSFKVEMICDVRDIKGKLLFTKKSIGTGEASLNEFKSKADAGLAGKRATTATLILLQKTFLTYPEW